MGKSHGRILVPAKKGGREVEAVASKADTDMRGTRVTAPPKEGLISHKMGYLEDHPT